MNITLYPLYFIHSLFVKSKKTFFSAGYKCLYPECDKNGMTPWQHYIIIGRSKGYSDGNDPSDSAFFSGGYELEYPDVKQAGLNPWRHYAEHGHNEGRDNGLHPNEKLFFPEGYLRMYPDVARAKADPWKHYVLHGIKEGRDNGLHPDEKQFFPEGYLQMYPDVARAKADPWKHYVLHGIKEGRDNGWHPEEKNFFPDGYLCNYKDVKNAGVDPWKHYVLCGKSEGRNNGTIGVNFSTEGYLLNYPEARTAIDPWKHYAFYCKNKKENDYLNDYSIRLSGHESEIVRSIYLTKCRTKNINKRALLIGHEFNEEGAAVCLLNVAKILKSEGYAVDIAVKDSGDTSFIHMYDGIGADVFLLPNSTECIPEAENVVSGYDIVIVNSIIMVTYAKLCQKNNIPHLWFIYEDLSSIKRHFEVYSGSKERLLCDCGNIVCVSSYLSGCLRAEYGIDCRYINNFINDLSKTSVSFDDRQKSTLGLGKVRTFAVVGDVCGRNAQDTAVAAFLYISAVPGYSDKWKLFFVGKYGREASNPELGIRLESVTKNVPGIVWCGQMDENKLNFLRSIDFFIVPSLEEASSSVAIEAAMLGKPIIVTSHVGAKYLTDNGAGFIYEPGDSAALCNIVMKCLDMADDEYQKMSSQVRLNYEKTLSPAVYSSELSALIADAIDLCGRNDVRTPVAQQERASLRTLGSGRNVISFSNLEYIKFVDFNHGCRYSDSRFLDNPSSVMHDSVTGVVVPVYNGVGHLKVLVPSLFQNTDLPHKFIFVDDHSNEETKAFLNEAVRNRTDCVIVRNEKNLGFVKSINIGAKYALECCSNFVMLNSDTEVPSRWLSRLMKPIFDDEKISSVTPLSNRCDIFSFPFFNKREKNDKFLKEFGVEKINEAILNSNLDKYFVLPTGHGFCMAMSGKVWKKIGGLNELLFGRGYGEENEWSLRAELYGFRNVLIPNLYVAHHEKGSFSSEEKKANSYASQQIITTMFPTYSDKVQSFMREYPSADSFASIFLSLAAQKGYKPETFTDASSFMAKLSEDDGIYVCKAPNVSKVAVRLLGEIIFVGNARHFDNSLA